MNPIKRYVNTVERHLRMDRHTRLRIMHDLGSEIQTRLEQGEPPEAILAELGPAAAVAESFNREFAAPPKKSGWRWLLLACAGLAALAAAGLALWCLLAVRFALGSAGAASAGQIAAGVARRFFAHGGFVPAAALFAAARRLIQSRGSTPG